MTQPRLIRLDQWLQIMFGDNPPTRRTIWRWIEAGRIYPALPQLLTGKRWLVHMTAEGHLIWNEVQPDVVLISMADMTQAVGKAWWGAVDTLADLNRICGKTGQKFDIPRRAA